MRRSASSCTVRGQTQMGAGFALPGTVNSIFQMFQLPMFPIPSRR